MKIAIGPSLISILIKRHTNLLVLQVISMDILSCYRQVWFWTALLFYCLSGTTINNDTVKYVTEFCKEVCHNNHLSLPIVPYVFQLSILLFFQYSTCLGYLMGVYNSVIKDLKIMENQIRDKSMLKCLCKAQFFGCFNFRIK